jgi:hypothetical protein
METRSPYRGTLATLLFVALGAGCGGTTTDADPYAGAVFASDGTVYAFDSKFLASTDNTFCKPLGLSTPCYPVQTGYANGKKIQFYNLISLLFEGTSLTVPAPPQIGPVITSNLPSPIPVSITTKNADNSGGSHVDVFPNNCTPDFDYDPRLDAYTKTSQGPVFDSLPLAGASTKQFVWPVVATYQVSGVSGETCNDIKDSRSIAKATDAAPGAFGARRTAVPTSYELWPVLDMTANLAPFSSAVSTPTDPSWGPKLGWYRGLQLRYLDGGPIPTATVPDPNNPANTITTLVPMDGVLLATIYTNDPPAVNIVKVQTNYSVLLPAAPGDDAYSPIVRLHTFALPSGKKIGDYHGVCPVGTPAGTCPADYVDITKAETNLSFDPTIFIASTPQQ